MSAGLTESPGSEARRGFVDQGTPLVRPRRGFRLATVEDVARELGRVYRLADVGLISMTDATKRSFVLVSLARVLETAVIERRLAALEAIASERDEQAA